MKSTDAAAHLTKREMERILIARAEKAEARLAALENRTLEQVIAEEWGKRGMKVVETFDGAAKRWTIEAREIEEV